MMPDHNANGDRSSAGSFLATFAVVLLAIVVLFLVDTFLARLDLSENLAEARQLYEEGSRLAAQGRFEEAVKSFRSAVADARENPDYQLALARALTKQGRHQEAEDLLHELLSRDANDGTFNLALARLYTREGRAVDAAAYFHRAIYGQWRPPSGPRDLDSWVGERTPLAARFELTSLLAQTKSYKALLAELLPLQDEAPKDFPTGKRIAKLYVTAGSPGRAEAIYREMLHSFQEAQHDVEVRTGLADAEFAEGAYAKAEMDYQAVLKIQDTPAAREKLELCGQIVKLDPTLRGIGVKERFARSRTLVETAFQRFEQCRSASVGDADLEEKAQSALKSNVNAAALDDAKESNIDLAERLWHAAGQSCGSDTQSQEPVALVLAKIAPR
jgi:tetratricopeptide (TPR) repeat protein